VTANDLWRQPKIFKNLLEYPRRQNFMSRIKYNLIVISLQTILFIGLLASSSGDSTAATSQGTRTFFYPAGFRQ
jgi:hypothetical protein